MVRRPPSTCIPFMQNCSATRCGANREVDRDVSDCTLPGTRQGLEFLLKGLWQRGQWFLNYTLTDATYQDDTELFTFANEDHIAMVQKGDKISLVAPHRVNGGVEFALTPQWRVRFDGIYVGSQYLRGDDANERHRLDPYFIANFQTTYQFRNAQLFFRLENMFDVDYETYGAFFENTVDNTGVEPFLEPGAPLGAFGGVRIQF